MDLLVYILVSYINKVLLNTQSKNIYLSICYIRCRGEDERSKKYSFTLEELRMYYYPQSENN